MENEKDILFRTLFIIGWLGLLLWFHTSNDKPMLKTVWSTPSKIEYLVKPSIDSQYFTLIKSQDDNVFVNEYIINTKKLDTSTKNFHLLNDDNIRYTNVFKQISIPYFIKPLWKITKGIILLMLIIILTLTLWSKIGKVPWLLIICVRSGLISIAIIHGLYIFMLGGLFISPLGVISSTVFSMVIANDFYRYKINKTNNLYKRFLYSFWTSLSFMFCTFLGELLYYNFLNKDHYSFVMNEFFSFYSINRYINWVSMMTILSFIFGLVSLVLRFDDKPRTVQELNT